MKKLLLILLITACNTVRYPMFVDNRTTGKYTTIITEIVESRPAMNYYKYRVVNSTDATGKVVLSEFYFDTDYYIQVPAIFRLCGEVISTDSIDFSEKRKQGIENVKFKYTPKQ